MPPTATSTTPYSPPRWPTHAGSGEFRRIRETRPVHAPGRRTKTLDRPVAGGLRLNRDVLLVPEVPQDDREVVLMTADPGSPSARSLCRLAAQRVAMS
ncbi:hypothetical protein ACFSL4_32865 [Streptomyces caeni]|uniref:MmyB-like transcription regulator ligand binding domain-containing protein n=1 Tax=Streptomyces caeni TaxID=2307231 RepID=A0ABW4J2V5_9ACTN